MKTDKKTRSMTLKHVFSWIPLVIFLGVMGYIYREVFFHGKAPFPGGFLLSHYAPYSGTPIQGWEHGIPHKPIGVDQFRFFYPSRTVTHQQFIYSQPPLWNPYIFSGNPHSANVQSATYYPLTVLYYLFPQLTAWTILAIVQHVIAFIGMYAYLLFILQSRIVAFFGGFVFALSGFLVVWSQENAVVSHVAIWMPYIFLGIEGMIREKCYRFFLLTVLSLSFSFLAGFFQIAFYVYMFAFIYGIVRFFQAKNRTIFLFFALIGSFILSLVGSSIQLIPSIEAFLFSPRTKESIEYLFDTYLLSLGHLFTFFAPEMFGTPAKYNYFGGRGFYHETVGSIGAVPIFLAFVSLTQWKKNSFIRFFSLASVVTILLILHSPVTVWFYNLPLPFFSIFLPSRILVVTTFSLSVLSAFGLYYIATKYNSLLGFVKKSIFTILLVFIFLHVFLFVYIFLPKFSGISALYALLFYQFQNINNPNLFVTIAKNSLFSLSFLILILLGTYTIRTPRRITLLIVGASFIWCIYFFRSYIVLSPKEFVFPDHPVFTYLQSKKDYYRFVSLGSKIILPNIGSHFSLYSAEGLDPIFSHTYGQLFAAAANNGTIPSKLPSRIESLFPYVGDDKVATFSGLLRLLSLTGTRYIVAYDDGILPLEKRFPEDTFERDWRHGRWHGFIFKHALPRFFLTNSFIVESDTQKQFSYIFSDHLDLRTLILDKHPEQQYHAQSFGDVSLISYTPTIVHFFVSAKGNLLLFLSDSFYPGWKAYIDGKETPVLRAHSVYRAIEVPDGDHEVFFRYEPISYFVGRNISTIFWIILIGVSLLFLFFHFLFSLKRDVCRQC